MRDAGVDVGGVALLGHHARCANFDAAISAHYVECFILLFVVVQRALHSRLDVQELGTIQRRIADDLLEAPDLIDADYGFLQTTMYESTTGSIPNAESRRRVSPGLP